MRIRISNVLKLKLVRFFILGLGGVCFYVNVAYPETNTHNMIDVQKSLPKNYYHKQFQKVLDIIDDGYVHTLDMQKMTDEAIDGMLRSLDPYSGYYSGDELEFFRNHTEGEFGGIGVEVVYDNGLIKVVSPIDDLPAYKAGVKSGDYIFGIDGELVSNLGYMKSIKLMRGKPGTEVNILIARENSDSPKEIKLKRELVQIKAVKYQIERDKLGYFAYIRLVTFNKKTSVELKNAMNYIISQAQNDKKEFCGIILDLRDNPGGLLDQAIAVAEYFINEGVIVRIKDKKSEQKMNASKLVAKAPNVPIVILINGGSASASEIVAGAMQDHKRAIILGTNSFGKGLVQTFTQISERAAIKFTIAEYYTSNGRFINGKGIAPDIVVEQTNINQNNKKEDNLMSKPHMKDFLEKYKTKKQNSDPSKQTDNKIQNDEIIEMSDKYKTDYQYARAYDLIRGIVYSKKKS